MVDVRDDAEVADVLRVNFSHVGFVLLWLVADAAYSRLSLRERCATFAERKATMTGCLTLRSLIVFSPSQSSSANKASF